MKVLGRPLVAEIVRQWGLDDRTATQVCEFVLKAAAEDLARCRDSLVFCDEAGSVGVGTAMVRLEHAADRVRWKGRKYAG